ncbi:MAG TPA: DNA mismatch repair protein MutS, partial [Roseiflexaceae bacterium]|nr:DNA mismatch repair protein MutS [Roseiflexaceae bacterium]
AWRWEARTARDALLHHFGVRSLAGFGLAERSLAVRAAGAILQYAHETQNGATSQLTTLRTYTPGDVMFLDPQTRRNLELLEGNSGTSQGALVTILDQTRTPMGARLLRRWLAQPLLDIAHITRRQQAVAHFVDDAMLRATLRAALRQIGDMERIVNRVIQGVTVATPRDLTRLRDGLRALPEIVSALNGWLPAQPEVAMPVTPDADEPPLAADLQPAIAPPTLRGPSLREQREAGRLTQPRYHGESLFDDDADQAEEAAPAAAEAAAPAGETPPAPLPAIPQLDPCADVCALLEAALDDNPPALLGASDYLRVDDDGQTRRVIRPGFDAAIDEVVRANRDAQSWIAALEPQEQERTGIKSLRVDFNKVFGYYIEVPRSYADRVPADYIRKQTLTNGERYITEQLKQYEEIVLRARERLVELERQAFARIAADVANHGRRLLATARLLAEIDVYAALAEAAMRGRYVCPSLHPDTRLRITAGRHPVVERTLDDAFIPNSINLDTDTEQILVITGANMTGKSTVMRQVALIVLLAQIGSFVPADAAEIGIVDRIFTRIGAQDDIATGQSTFMVEMTETAAILAQGTRRSLIILDEVGRGTSTYDGMAIARALIEYLHSEPHLGCRTLFATHYHELTTLETVLPRVHNYHMAAVEQQGQVVFLHELRPGSADRSYGIHVAALAGIPRSVIRRAANLLAELERNAAPTVTPNAETAAPADQLSLFEAPPHPVLELLRRMEINELTPLEALNRLSELQRAVRSL